MLLPPALVQMSLHPLDFDYRREILRAAARDGSRAFHVCCASEVTVTELFADESRKVIGTSMNTVQAIARELGQNVIVLTGFGSVRTRSGAAATAYFPKDTRVYDVIDDLSYGATGLNWLKYLARDRAWRARCGRTIVLEKDMRKIYPGAAHIDNASHLTPSDVAQETRFVYVGSFDIRLDIEMIVNIAATYPIDIYGRPHPKWPQVGDELSRLAASSPAVKLMGAYDNDDLQRIFRDYTHGLIPYQTPHRLTKHINPDKIYHYLNAGLAVISSPIPQARKMEAVLSLYTGVEDVCDLARSAQRKRAAWNPDAYRWAVRWQELVAALC